MVGTKKLIISDTVHNEVHFANEGDDTALVLRVYEQDGKRLVDVPNILLQTDSKIVAYTYGDNETESHTHFIKKFTVKPRPKPADYVYTETEVYDYNRKLDNEFGIENAGKALVIDKNGKVVPGSVAGGGGSTSLVSSVELLASKWEGEGHIFHQTVEISGAGINSKIDLTPDVQQLSELLTAEISLTTVNNDGIVTVYAIGAAPTSDYTMQVIVSEVIEL